MLSNPYYMGKAAVYRRRYQKLIGQEHKTHCEWRPEEEQIHLPDGVVPPLVDEETFEAVQAQLTRNRELAIRNARNPEDALLRCGLIYCGYCGCRMTMMHSGKRPTVYACATYHKRIGKCKGTTIVASIIDREAWNYAVEIIRNPALVEQALEAQKKQDNTERDLSPIERSISNVERKIKNYKRTIDSARNMSENATPEDEEITNGIIDDAVAQIKTLEKQRRALEKQRAQVLVEQVDLEKEKEAIENFRNWCKQFREKIDDPSYTPTYDEKRRACERLGIRVQVWRNDHKPRREITALPTDIASLSS
ncbi:MAG: recombinase zinc beta ribbon domain-containing protein, partial [Ktedonobacteraceae bacterium]|nr:recombinase zinc beta ribbon domain-containing protein [Ktedonobacteraceae bacterium]